MWIIGFYRIILSLCCGILFWLFCIKSLWLALLAAIVVRVVWFAVERVVERIAVEKDFKRHVYSFKQQLGPYGIRLANKAEKDYGVKKSLAEVFTSNSARLKKNIDQLKMMDTLFSAGMRPDGEAYLLHDCKLKYGAYRVAQQDKAKNGSF
jgi:hypothetical protein